MAELARASDKQARLVAVVREVQERTPGLKDQLERILSHAAAVATAATRVGSGIIISNNDDAGSGSADVNAISCAQADIGTVGDTSEQCTTLAHV